LDKDVDDVDDVDDDEADVNLENAVINESQ